QHTEGIAIVSDKSPPSAPGNRHAGRLARPERRPDAMCLGSVAALEFCGQSQLLMVQLDRFDSTLFVQGGCDADSGRRIARLLLRPAGDLVMPDRLPNLRKELGSSQGFPLQISVRGVVDAQGDVQGTPKKF